LHPFLASASMGAAVELARKVASTPGIPLLIEAEPGAGAEELAHYIHQRSPAPPGRFAAVHCRGVSVEQAEAELLRTVAAAGRSRGAARAGAGTGLGTLLVDEVAHLGHAAQAFLVTLFGDGHATPRGRPGHAQPTRVVAATSFDLRAMTEDRGFRSELLDLLSVVGVRLPPLRQRRDDIVVLAESLLATRASALGKPMRALSEAARAKLIQHAWPGNCRELQAVIERALVIASGDTVDADAIVFTDGRAVVDHGRDQATALSVAFSNVRARRGRPATLGEIEQEYIRWLLEETHGNRTAASRMLGVSYPTIKKKIADYGIDLRLRNDRRT
jgi:DNA-binding NtrC family response regulator